MSSLPKIQLPLFDITVPSTGKVVKYRPFTMKEEKILLIAQESKDIDQAINSIKQIINNCVHDINVEELAIFDLEYLLINIRAKSVSNEIKFTITDPDTEEKIELEFDIGNVSIKTEPDHNKFIKADDQTTIVMKYPTFDQIKTLSKYKDDKTEAMTRIMIECVDSVVVEDSKMKLSSFSDEEVTEFFDSLPNSVVSSIENFFETMPVLRHEVSYKNKNGVEKTFVVEGMETFFI